MLQDQVTSDGEDDGGDQSCNEKTNQPRKDDGSDSRPLDRIKPKSCDTSPGDGTNDSMSGGDRQSAGRDEENPGRGIDKRANHGKHQQLGLSLEETDLHEATLDRVSCGGSHEERAKELAYGGN